MQELKPIRGDREDWVRWVQKGALPPTVRELHRRRVAAARQAGDPGVARANENSCSLS